MADPTLPLADVPAYRPDGPVNVIDSEFGVRAWYATDLNGLRVLAARDGVTATNRSLSLLLDPTGCRSLAVAIGAACGLDVSGGVVWRFGPDDALGRCVMLSGESYDTWYSDRVPALYTIDLTTEHAAALALAAVARVVLGGSNG